MPLSYLVLMITAVILAAALTVWLLQGFGGMAFVAIIPVCLGVSVALRMFQR